MTVKFSGEEGILLEVYHYNRQVFKKQLVMSTIFYLDKGPCHCQGTVLINGSSNSIFSLLEKSSLR